MMVCVSICLCVFFVSVCVCVFFFTMTSGKTFQTNHNKPPWLRWLARQLHKRKVPGSVQLYGVRFSLGKIIILLKLLQSTAIYVM